MASAEIERQLTRLREDYRALYGAPFTHFYCPILCKDEETELCLGHIVNEAIPNSRRTTVVQRSDVDRFYGAAFEADFTALLAARLRSPSALLLEKLPPRVDAKLMVDGEEFEYYRHVRGQVPSGHTMLLFESDDGKCTPLILKRPPQQVIAAEESHWRVVVDADMRLASLVSLIKAAFLTLFRLFGVSVR